MRIQTAIGTHRDLLNTLIIDAAAWNALEATINTGQTNAIPANIWLESDPLHSTITKAKVNKSSITVHKNNNYELLDHTEQTS